MVKCIMQAFHGLIMHPYYPSWLICFVRGPVVQRLWQQRLWLCVCDSMVLDVVHFDVAVFSCTRIQSCWCHDHVIIPKKVCKPFYRDIMSKFLVLKKKWWYNIWYMIYVYFLYFMILMNRMMAYHIVSSYIHDCPYIFQLWMWWGTRWKDTESRDLVWTFQPSVKGMSQW